MSELNIVELGAVSAETKGYVKGPVQDNIGKNPPFNLCTHDTI